jgi:outer membrane protein insertion porin family
MIVTFPQVGGAGSGTPAAGVTGAALLTGALASVLLLVWAAPACGDGPPCEIVWSGVESVGTSVLEDAAGFEGGTPLEEADLQAAAERIVNAYRAQGYLDASAVISTSEGEKNTVSIAVCEGRRFAVGAVTLEGTSKLSARDLISRCAGLRRGAPMTQDGIERSIEELLRAYGEAGYAGCRVSPKEFTYNIDGSVDVALQISEGRRCVVERLDVSGGKTKSSTACRTAGLKAGEPFDPWSMGEVVSRLSSSGLFSRVESPVIRRGSADSLVVIEVPVVEPPSSSVSGLLGYSGRQGGAVGFLDLELGNILGTAREGAFRWENSGGGLSSYSAGYVEPWLGGLPISLELGVNHLAQDTTYSTTGFSADLNVDSGGMLSFAVGAGREKTALAGETEGVVTRRSRLAIRAGAELDARDDPLDARSGLLLAASGDWGSRVDGIPGTAEENSWRVVRYDLASELHRRLHGRHGVYLGARWRGIRSDEESIPWDQLLRFGGASSLRGYREDQFRAEETLLLQVEHRIAIGDGGSRLFLFADSGFLRGGGAPDGAQIGYGLGIRAAAAGGQMGVDFGMGAGDSWSEAKVHVRMKRLF